ncbi:MAG: FtsW/RodA/SpoVE family cell cycle protein [Firmicutes bacterium]|nr:FtsW/RodA/SpoVE family cell cycle protein [Bacillota bacterium]
MKNIINNIKSLFSKMDKTLFFLTVLFFLFGLLNIVTASSREAVVRYDLSTYHYFYKQSEMLIVGLILSYIILNMKTKAYNNLIIFAYAAVLLLVLCLFPFGIEVNGAKNWLPIPLIGTIQPSELSKPVMIILLSVLFEKYSKKFKSNDPKRYEKIGIILIVAFLIPILTFLQKDLGSVLIMLGVFGILFLASSIKKQDKFNTIVLIILAGILGLGIMYFRQGYILSDAQMARFDFYNPCSKYETTGYQVCNGFIAINDGGMFGLGIGKSKQKYSYIPEPHTDSIFAIIAEEYGVLGTTFIFIGYILVLFRILKISMNTTNIKNRLISLGIASYIFMHIFINLGGLFGVIPLTGVPLPFLSYGGTYAISLMCSLAVVQRIHIENKIEKSKKILNK